MKITSDTIAGVYICDAMPGERLSQEDFYDALDTLALGEVISADVDPQMLARIDAEYGVTQ